MRECNSLRVNLKIYVKEEYTTSGQRVYDTVDEKRFIELYGEYDFKRLLEQGHVGDTIGQGKIYYAVIAPAKESRMKLPSGKYGSK